MPAYTPALKKQYEDRYAHMRITKPRQAQDVANLILRGKPRYQAISAQTGVPWEFIGLTHYRECACNFRGVLHNGELIVGTNKKTRLVPAGYGPFATWEEAALSALRRQGLDKETDWSIGKLAYRIEGFNGYGYHRHGVPSPYLWGGTNQYVRGKYVRDGVFDPNFVDPQMGVMPVLSLLRYSKPTPIAVGPDPGPAIPPASQKKKAAAAASVAGLTAFLHDNGVLLVGSLVVLALGVAGYLVYRHMKQAKRSAKTG